MASATRHLKTVVTLAPTSHVLPNGVPEAPMLKLNARPLVGHFGRKAGGLPTSHSGMSYVGLVRKNYTTREQCSIAMNGTYRRLLSARVSAIGSVTRAFHGCRSSLDASSVPDFSPYRANSDSNNRALSYFMVGSMGVISASVAKSTITGFLETMAASADVLALAKVELDLASIPEGKNVIIKWRGKPVFVRHRTQGEIDEARQTDWKKLRDPESDEDRTKKPEWLVMLGVCTHLGCVPIGESGDYGGWFCPCHGSHYDIC